MLMKIKHDFRKYSVSRNKLLNCNLSPKKISEIWMLDIELESQILALFDELSFILFILWRPMVTQRDQSVHSGDLPW